MAPGARNNNGIIHTVGDNAKVLKNLIFHSLTYKASSYTLNEGIQLRSFHWSCYY